MLEPAVRDLPTEDIYALLGIRADASRLLAREMYWARVQALHGEDDSPAARQEIEALNEALAIIMDDGLRAAYDVQRPNAEVSARDVVPAAPDVPRKRDKGALLPAVLTLVVVGVALTIWPVSLAWTIAVTAIALVSTTACFLQSSPLKIQSGPLDVLRLLPGAAPADIDLAYRARAQELLIEVTRNIEALHDLDRLDRAYVQVMGLALGTSLVSTTPDVVPAPRRRSLVASPGRLALRTAITAAGLIASAARGAVSAARPLSRRAASTGHRAEGWVRHRVHAAAEAAGREAQQMQERRRAGAPPPPTIDLDQRLAASFKASAIQIAESAAPAPPSTAAIAAPSVWLLLTAAAGTRRVPVGDRPLRIGSAPECDLVLPERAGVSPEHVMIWRHGDAVILHVTDPQAECQVNGDTVTWARLDDGDEVRVGTVVLRIAGA
jgi:hypothetical protein